MGHLKIIYILLAILFFSNQAETQNDLPNRITIQDFSFDSYTGKFEYQYELNLAENDYELIQLFLYETDFKKKEKKRKSKVVKTISKQQIARLIDAIETKRDSFGLEDLGYDYKWFSNNLEETYDLSRKLWEKRWPSSPAWNVQQSQLIKEQLVDFSNISEAVQRRFFNKGYITLHSSGRSSLKLQLYYADSVTIIERGDNYRGLPWKLNDNTFSYNQNISDIIYDIIPENKGWNKNKLEGRDKAEILNGIVDQVYQDECKEKVKKLVFLNYEKEISQLKTHYEVSGYKEEGSYSNNWDGEKRLCMNVKDTNEIRNICFRLCLTLEKNTLFSRDSIIKKGAYYLDLVNRIPFLLDYLDEDNRRRIHVSFDNGNSLSDKVKNKQSGSSYKFNGVCLKGKNENYLNQCVSFVLFNEYGNGSNWIITPDLDVILVYYHHSIVYKYSDKDLGLKGPSIRYACKHFDLNGNLK